MKIAIYSHYVKTQEHLINRIDMFKSMSTLFLLLAVSSFPAFSADFALGEYWAREGKSITYAFLEKHEFWIRYAPDGKVTRQFDGVWKLGEKICWLSDNTANRHGNIMIYIGETQCCLRAEILGKSLVLSYIWQKPLPSSEIYAETQCSNRVLVKKTIKDSQDEERVIATKSDIRAIHSALKLYRLDNGFYPSTEQGLQALLKKPETGKIPRNWKRSGYIDRLPKDPWKKDYQYLNPGLHGEIDIFSYGADGQPGGEGANADLGSWNID